MLPCLSAITNHVVVVDTILTFTIARSHDHTCFFQWHPFSENLSIIIKEKYHVNSIPLFFCYSCFESYLLPCQIDNEHSTVCSSSSSSSIVLGFEPIYSINSISCSKKLILYHLRNVIKNEKEEITTTVLTENVIQKHMKKPLVCSYIPHNLHLTLSLEQYFLAIIPVLFVNISSEKLSVILNNNVLKWIFMGAIDYHLVTFIFQKEQEKQTLYNFLKAYSTYSPQCFSFITEKISSTVPSLNSYLFSQQNREQLVTQYPLQEQTSSLSSVVMPEPSLLDPIPKDTIQFPPTRSIITHSSLYIASKTWQTDQWQHYFNIRSWNLGVSSTIKTKCVACINFPIS